MPTLILSNPLGSDDAQRIGLSIREYAVGEIVSVNDFAATTLIRTGYALAVGTGQDVLIIGDGPPNDSIGTDGQWYLDELDEVLWGPRADGLWPADPIRPDRGIATVAVGADFHLRVTYSSGTVVDLGSVRGATGAVGPTGPTGPTGPQGAQGVQGAQGPAGAGSPDATTGAKGSVQLAGDLGGTAAAPQVTGGTHHSHTSLQISDATSAATGSRVAVRDSAGRLQVTDPAVDADVATQGWVSKRVPELDARTYGVVADGTTDCVAAINQALVDAAGKLTVVLPAGDILVGGEVRVPSRSWLRGAGIDTTRLVMKAGVDGNLNVVTNADNNKAPRTVYSEYLHISDLSIDGNRPNRATPAVASIMDGSCINLSTTRHAVIERVKVLRGYRHGIDLSASEYPESAGVTATAQGPSYNITVRDCEGIGPFGDDAITTHFSWGLRIEDCRTSTTGIDFSGSQGIEIDDGSRDVVVKNCYAYGFVKGFQAKGHVDTVPAKQVVFENCVADSCGYGFDISHYDPATYATVTTRRVASDVVLRACRSINNVTRHSDYPERRALRITGYDNVQVYDFVSMDNPGGNVLIGVGASNVVLHSITFDTVGSSPFDPAEGLVQFRSDTGKGCEARRVNVRGATPSQATVVWLGTSAVPTLTWDTIAVASGFGGTVMVARDGNWCQLQLRDVTPSSAATLQVLAAAMPVGRRPIRQTDILGLTTSGTPVRLWLASDGILRGLFPSTAAVSASLTYLVGG